MLNFLRRLHKPQQQPLLFHTDIHCHVLPGVDDGSPDVSTSAELVERMSGWGIRRIIATPHVTQSTFENTPERLDAALNELRAELTRRGIDVELSRSAEYRIDALLNEHIDKGILTPYPGNYLLVENSYTQEPVELDNFLFELKTKGFRPILAHPERYVYYSRYNPRRYGQLYRSGTFLQLNLLSFAGYYGKEERRIAETLLEKGYVDFLGTDLHSHKHADAIEEFLASRAYARLAEKLTPLNDSKFA